MKTIRIPLPAHAPGHERFLTVHEFGSGEKKAYLQAALHADEWPGLLTLQHLITRLQALEAVGRIKQRVQILPYANPVGLSQRHAGRVLGRYDGTTGQNFNRGMAIQPEALIERVLPELGQDAAANDRKVREALLQLASEKKADYEIEILHKTLLGQSLDANLMLDLHCDYDSLPHVFYGTHQRETGTLLSDCLGFPIRLEEDVRGTVAFDGTHTQPWVRLMEATDAPFADPCFAATIELRGQHSVSDALASRDAEGILAFLEAQGYVEASGAQHQEQAGSTQAISVDQVKVLYASAAGLVVYHRQLGEMLQPGDHLADIVLLDKDQPERIAVHAPTSGILFSIAVNHLSFPGSHIAMIASEETHIKPGTQLSF
ncbi:succinylglutamate desuccinylase/aspartoacylase family protein [Nitrincola alkalilacustris]|uniref:succinylglutamate desuccinylase/aspartoacylase family protein n=1 Tax=Nitrincola alkalilacustris TaxID=1571224 RepID=UPI00124E4B28|nr:succinylglutamate desuccinylase/aspartoacylase family protein [Nitrincola alkalilacustris]